MNKIKKIFPAIILAMTVLGSNPSWVGAVELAKTPPIQGTFLQLLDEHGEWETQDWEDLFACFQDLGLSQIVVQWIVYDQTSFYPSDHYETVAKPPLETILSMAEATGMEVLVGLVHDPDYWQKVRQEPALVEVYLQHIKNRSIDAAKELNTWLEQFPSFSGWYIPVEIDDVNWKEVDARKAIYRFIKQMSGELHDLNPAKKIALSGFSNGETDPKSFELFWDHLLGTTSVDIAYFQDGVGVEKLGVRELPMYLTAISNAAQKNHRDLQVIVEVFSRSKDQTDASDTFKAVPAPLTRITEQIVLANTVTPDITAFSVPEYMCPQGGESADKLHEDYLEFLSEKNNNLNNQITKGENNEHWENEI